MMRSISLVIAFMLLSSTAVAQPPDRELHGKVFYIKDGKQQWLAGVTVKLEQTGNSDETNDDGHFFIPLQYLQAAQVVTLSIDATDWQIHDPPAGRLEIPDDPGAEIVQIEVLPMGSKEFLDRPTLSMLLSDAVSECARRVEEVDQAAYFTRSIKMWAQHYGLSIEEVRLAVEQWIAEVEKSSDDDRELGVATFAKERFDEAAEHFGLAAESGKDRLAAMMREQASFQKRNAAVRLRIAQDLRSQAEAYRRNYRFNEAIQACKEALEYADRKEVPLQWAGIQNSLGFALYGRGRQVEGDESARLLESSVRALESALVVRTREEEPDLWAHTKNGQGLAFLAQATRTQGKESLRLLALATDTFRENLKVWTRDGSPQDWALTQGNLGNVLQETAVRVRAEDGGPLLAEAVAAYRVALEVNTREEAPRRWAGIQSDLAAALHNQAIRSSGPKSAELLVESVSILEKALEVTTREQSPVEWANIHIHLGNSLLAQGQTFLAEEATRFLGEAVRAYSLALEVRKREVAAQEWAAAQHNLGIAFSALSRHSSGEEILRLLAKSAEAYRLALEVRTFVQFPQDWATTQDSLGNTLLELGTRTKGDDGEQLLSEALEAYGSVLKVYTRREFPQLWARTQNNRGAVLKARAARVEKEERVELLNEAHSSFALAISELQRQKVPGFWMVVRNNQAQTLEQLGDFWAAADAYREVLSENPNVGGVILNLADLYQNGLYDPQSSVALLQEWLERHPEDVSARLMFAEVLLATGNLGGCEEQSQRYFADRSESSLDGVGLALRVLGALATNNLSVARSNLLALLEIVQRGVTGLELGWHFEGTFQFVWDSLNLPNREQILGVIEAFREGDCPSALLRLDLVLRSLDIRGSAQDN